MALYNQDFNLISGFNIINHCNSDSNLYALSARMGKILNEKIDSSLSEAKSYIDTSVLNLTGVPVEGLPHMTISQIINAIHTPATQDTDGMMSSNDKKKVDSIHSNLNFDSYKQLFDGNALSSDGLYIVSCTQAQYQTLVETSKIPSDDSGIYVYFMVT